KFGRFDYVAQGDRLAVRIGDFDADRGFAGDALDEDGFGAQGEAEVFGKARDPAVFDAGLWLEFERGDDGAGIDLRDVAADVEFGAFLFDGAGVFLQLAFVHFFAALGGMKQGKRRQAEGGLIARDLRVGLRFGRAAGRGRFFFMEFDYGRLAGRGFAFRGFAGLLGGFVLFVCRDEGFFRDALRRDRRAAGD